MSTKPSRPEPLAPEPRPEDATTAKARAAKRAEQRERVAVAMERQIVKNADLLARLAK